MSAQELRGGAATAAFEVRGLSYRYPEAGAPALRGVDLEIARGELVVLAGRSGSGKTTLLRAASGLVPHFHGGEVEGQVSTAGMDVREHGPAELASMVGYVFQDPEAQVVSTTVAAELSTPLELRGVASAERKRAVEETALALGLADLLDRSTSTLSGGELQRVAIGAALVTRPALLLLDEPTSQLDPVAGDELLSLLRRVNRDVGVAILLSEHRLERCLDGADRAVALADGAVSFDGSPDGLLRHLVEVEPDLATPGARLCGGLGIAPRADLRSARAAAGPVFEGASQRLAPSAARVSRADEPLALSVEGLTVELRHEGSEAPGPPALDRLSLELRRGERVAVMGANGAGKTTLLRAATGLLEPDAGRVEASGEVAMLPQRPDSMFARDRVGDELPTEAGRAALERLGLDGFEERDPRDISGGERERLALALVLAGRIGSGHPAPAAVLLDEPTRGLDRGRKADLAAVVEDLAEGGSALLIATHDVEFAALFAERVVILGRGRVVADGAAGALLSGGIHFSTEVARITGGAALTPEQALRIAAHAAGGADPQDRVVS